MYMCVMTKKSRAGAAPAGASQHVANRSTGNDKAQESKYQWLKCGKTEEQETGNGSGSGNVNSKSDREAWNRAKQDE